MTIQSTTHLNFRSQARAALTQYQSVFGGDLTVITYADACASHAPADEIMWGQVESAAGFRIMAYDVPPVMDWDAGTIPVYVSIRGNDEDELRNYWERLSDGATVVQPLEPAQWSPLYGMLTDRFGITWVLDIAVTYQG